ncbi:hypothetical protein GCM10017771_78310 [Streptomyces capitiformicae]|uniref:Polyphosphate kinase-2-related domain-containing protein n=1 Tax=Streptomyces capitiformicae TaxID=2014920 RepID=A0A918ZJ44_9ACTN|nr:hypothetical protein GCM10017771_78310 [Streptomyces capitiformicae]
MSDTEQQERFRRRLEDPLRRWKLSPMALESPARREAYSRAKDDMLVHTDITEAPWYVVESDDKRRARLNMIAHLRDSVPYHEVMPSILELPERPPSTGYERPPRDLRTYVRITRRVSEQPVTVLTPARARSRPDRRSDAARRASPGSAGVRSAAADAWLPR